MTRITHALRILMAAITVATSMSAPARTTVTSHHHDTTGPAETRRGGSDDTPVSRTLLMPEVTGRQAIEQFHPIYQDASGADIRVGILFDAPSAYYDFDGKTLSWQHPSRNATLYMMAIVEDPASHQFLPGCKVTAQWIDPHGRAIGSSVTLQETWDARFRHYGENFAFPENSTTASLKLKIEPARERRRGQALGNFFTKPVELEFASVNITTGTLSPSILKQEKKTLKSEPDHVNWPSGRRPYVKPTPYPGSPSGHPAAIHVHRK